MQKLSVGRKSTTNSMRSSSLDREIKSYASVRSEPRVSNLARTIRRSGDDSSQIPRPRIRSASSERVSNIKISTLKGPVAGRMSRSGVQNLITPVSSRASASRFHPDLPSGPRGRSPSAERASGLSATTTKTKKDIRPLTDKNYQTTMLNRIDNFFRDADLLSMLNPSGSLKPISLKMFVTISDFLLQMLDMKHDFTVNNYMEELPKIAKKLHYPGAMTKSWLKTANTMHSWHHVLAWLSWLVEICEVKDLATQQFQLETLPFTNADDGEVIHRNEFAELLKLYQVWNDGREDEEALLIDKYIEGIANDYGCNEKQLLLSEAELNEINKKHDDTIKLKKEVDNETDALSEQLKLLREEENRQLVHIKTQEQFRNNHELEVQKLDSELIFLEKEKEQLLKEHEELNSSIDQQPMTIEERDIILKKCLEIQSYMKQFEDHLDEIQKEAWTLDIKFAHVIENLRKAILAYNADIVINVTQDKNELKMPESSLADTNIMIRLNEKAEIMMNVQEMMLKQMINVKSMIDLHTNELESLHDKKKMLDQEANERLLKIDEKRHCLKDLKLRAKQEETILRESIKKLEEDKKHIIHSTPDIPLIMSEITEAREKYEAVKRRRIFLERSAESFFTRFYEAINNGREELVKINEQIENL